MDSVYKVATTQMDKAIAALAKELSKMRSGRAHTSLIEHVMVMNYNNLVPLMQVASINVEDARCLTVSPWDKQNISAIEKAIRNADLGLNPVTQGMKIRVPLPPLTEERRRDMVKLVKKEAETAKIAVRNLRRDANDKLQRLFKDKDISEDEHRQAQVKVQRITDDAVTKIEKTVSQKEEDLLAF